MGIRVVPNETVPVQVYRILLPHERRVITVRFHPAVVGVPVIVASCGLIAAVVLSFMNLSAHALAITWSLCLLALLYGLFRTLNWLNSYFVVTSYRMLWISGLLRTDVYTLPLSAAARIRFRRSFLGRLLGYGQFVLEGTRGDQRFRTVNFLAYPEQLYIEVTGMVFQDPGD